MTVPTVSCTNCGKNFTTDDLRGTSCRYCGTLLAHHARAAEQVAVVNQMLADRNGNGIPDAYEGLVANAQANAMNQAFGYGAPPPYGAPYPPAGGFGQPMNPMYGAQVQYQMANVGQQVNNVMSKVMLIVVISIIAVVVLTFGIIAFTFFVTTTH